MGDDHIVIAACPARLDVEVVNEVVSRAIAARLSYSLKLWLKFVASFFAFNCFSAASRVKLFSHFGSRPFLLELHVACARGAVFLCSFVPCQTARHAPHGMDVHSCARWMVAGDSRSPQSSSEVAEGQTAKSKWPEGSARTTPTASPSRASGPDTAMLNARARVAKLEAAMVAIGESDPAYLALQDALKTARAQAQEKLVQDRIAGTESFLERARKRVVAVRPEVEQAKDAVIVPEGKLALEEEEVRKAEARLLVLQH